MGGVLFATTRSFFNIQGSYFTYNNAASDATITALKTSSVNTFLIKSCWFENNYAASNLISVKQSDG